MLSVTDAAGAHLTGILTERDCPDDVAIRFLCEPSGISMSLDNPSPGDATIEHDGRTILLLDEQAAQFLDQETLDVEKSEEGEKLVLTQGGGGTA